MPLLDDDMIRTMRAKIDHCDQCLGTILCNYCRQCDEFFTYGHAKNCIIKGYQDKHKGHRTY